MTDDCSQKITDACGRVLDGISLRREPLVERSYELLKRETGLHNVAAAMPDLLETARTYVDALLGSLPASTSVSPGQGRDLRAFLIRCRERGIPHELLLRGCFFVAGVIRDDLLEELQGLELPPPASELATRFFLQCVDRSVDEVSSRIVKADLDVAGTCQADRQQESSDPVHELFSTALPISSRAIEAFADFGGDQGTKYAVAAVSGAEDDDHELERALAAIRSRWTREALPILTVHDEHAIAVLPADELSEASIRKRLDAALGSRRRTRGRFLACIGPPEQGPHGVAQSYRRARAGLDALKQLPNGPRVTTYRRILPFLLLARDVWLTADLRRLTLEPLHAEDPERGERLTETIRVLAAHRWHLRASARRLEIHPSTLDERLHRIRELTGLEHRDTDDRLLLTLAVWAELVPVAGSSTASIELGPSSR